MNELRQSDGGVIPEKFPNVPEPTGAEGMEERPPAKGNELQGPLYRTQSRESMGVALERIRLAVRRERKGKLTALYHHIYNIDFLREAYLRLKRDATPGVDGKTTGRPWRQICKTCLGACGVERTGRLRCGGCTSPNPTDAKEPWV